MSGAAWHFRKTYKSKIKRLLTLGQESIKFGAIIF